MRLMELIRMAMRTVTGSPLRTFLTMLGVIIGVGSVVTLVAIGQGTADNIAKQYEGLGTNTIVVNILGTGRATQLDYAELMKFEELPEIDLIAPTVTKAGSNIKYMTDQESYTVIGTNDRYKAIMKTEVASGRFLSAADLEFRTNVAVLGSKVSEKFFGQANPVGEDLNIDGIVFTIVGVLQEKGSNLSGSSVDSSVIVPLETARRQFKLGNIRTTYLEATNKEEIASAKQTMTQYLTFKFKSSSGFLLVNQEELIAARTAATDTLTSQLVSVACISLVVGGIGIMNIMLVTVSERTREIGIRKSIGAKRRNILLQFLFESIVISGLGGLIGLVLGIAVSLSIPHFIPTQATSISVKISMYAFLFSVLVGIVFGIYPANKASRLRPIDALRFD